MLPRPTHRENYVAEWYGFRVWPTVDSSPDAKLFQTGRNCPFISAATGVLTQCQKRERTGVCTISALSEGGQRDWLACPARILDRQHTLLGTAVRRLFGVGESERLVLRPVNSLSIPAVREEVSAALADGRGRTFVFSQNWLGGEVKIPKRPASPQVAIDSSVVELLPDGRGGFALGRYLMFEIQTADFHGSPKHALRHLSAARDADPDGYHQGIKDHPEWPNESVEGPNIANIFKRTIYQTILEIQLARDPDCVGFAIVLPIPVWESWLRHLGNPALYQDAGFWRLRAPEALEQELVEPDRAWIYVTDIDRDSAESPHTLRVVQSITTTSADLIHHVFERAPEHAASTGALADYKQSLDARIRKFWPRGRPSRSRRQM